MGDVVITGIGMVTPLGRSPADVLARITAGETALEPSPLGEALPCRGVARVRDFDAQQYFPDNKMLRLMNRDSELAVAAARLALADAQLVVDRDYASHDIALYGSTGLSGMPLEETARLVQHAAADDGSLDLERFGRVALRRIRPVLSFKILANMPICFVSIFERLAGPNAVYTPWEGQGAQAIAAGVRAIRRGDVPCAVVGGCDVKCHALGLISLRQLGALAAPDRHGQGTVPSEGAAFLVLEDAPRAALRGARVYAKVGAMALRSSPEDQWYPIESLMLNTSIQLGSRIVAAGDGAYLGMERGVFHSMGIESAAVLWPKAHVGNMFAAAAAMQVGLAAAMAAESGVGVLVNCFGFGRELGCFVLEAA